MADSLPFVQCLCVRLFCGLCATFAKKSRTCFAMVLLVCRCVITAVVECMVAEEPHAIGYFTDLMFVKAQHAGGRWRRDFCLDTLELGGCP